VSEETAFLSAISAAPDDDTARLVYADWLDERSDPRAEYLRLEVKRHRMTPRERRKDDPFYQLERLRPHATPDWLSRIDRTTRYSAYWPQDQRWLADRNGLIGKPLALVESRGNHNTRFPKALDAGDYFYVFSFDRCLLLVGRMRIERRVETLLSAGTIPSVSFTSGIAGTEGTPIRFDLPVTTLAMSRLSWFSGKEERFAKLDAEGRLNSATTVHGVLRLTPRTAADLDAILRGDPLS
jgi:uncharacterized protein (TIGR02996 family)